MSTSLIRFGGSTCRCDDSELHEAYVAIEPAERLIGWTVLLYIFSCCTLLENRSAITPGWRPLQNCEFHQRSCAYFTPLFSPSAVPKGALLTHPVTLVVSANTHFRTLHEHIGLKDVRSVPHERERSLVDHAT